MGLLPLPPLSKSTKLISMRKLTATLCLITTLAIGFALGIAWTGSVHDGADSEYFRALRTMGGSGIDWIDAIFRYCVVLLVDLARVFGISYEALNIWVFVIIQPLIIVILLIWALRLRRKIKKLRR
tara:strand:+ start:42 stop:419 length:378 start_codon:yes stop_codon:yes gene_type:complete